LTGKQVENYAKVVFPITNSEQAHYRVVRPRGLGQERVKKFTPWEEDVKKYQEKRFAGKNTAAQSKITIGKVKIMKNYLTGKILISHPSMPDPYLRNLVLIILESDIQGSVALCLNKESGATVLELLAQNNKNWDGDEVLFVGGPKNESSLFMVHSSGWESENTYDITDDISISSDHKMSDLAMEDGGPEFYRFIVGVMSWPPKQLETELDKSNMWLIIDSTPEMVWERSGTDQWEYAIKEYSKTAVRKYFK
jgi:putative transcriptional regulator